MKPPPMTVFIPAPRVLNNGADFNVLSKMTLSELCSIAEIPMRVSGPDKAVICIAGDEHFISNRRYYVGVGSRWQKTRNAALKVLEVLAHGFHDYATRECICNRGLFAIPKRHGRPTKGRRAMTARERMSVMRERRRRSSGNKSVTKA